jgi:polyhydroxyalkanoate synthesis regulator phasin
MNNCGIELCRRDEHYLLNLYKSYINSMNTQTNQISKAAVIASKAIDSAEAAPGKIFRLPGHLVRKTQSAVYRFTTDFKALRAEVRRERALGMQRIAAAKQAVRETKSEKGQAVKEVVALGAENVRQAKEVVTQVRTSVQARIALATKRMEDQKAIMALEKEAEECTKRIDAYEARIQDLESQMQTRFARSVDAPMNVTPLVITPKETFVPAPSRSENPVPKEYIPDGTGFQSLIRDHGKLADPEFAAATSEIEDAPEEPVPAGASHEAKDVGDDQL